MISGLQIWAWSKCRSVLSFYECLRDYVYIPLGGNRVPFLRLILNTWIVFLLSGLWHGASWTFVIWGALHAIFLTLAIVKNRIVGKKIVEGRISRMLSVIMVNIGVTFAWLFFRAGTLSSCREFLCALFKFDFDCSLYSLCGGYSLIKFGLCGVAIFLLALSYLTPKDCEFRSTWGRCIFMSFCVFFIVFLGMPTGGEFIYTRF